MFDRAWNRSASRIPGPECLLCLGGHVVYSVFISSRPDLHSSITPLRLFRGVKLPSHIQGTGLHNHSTYLRDKLWSKRGHTPRPTRVNGWHSAGSPRCLRLAHPRFKVRSQDGQISLQKNCFLYLTTDNPARLCAPVGSFSGSCSC